MDNKNYFIGRIFYNKGNNQKLVTVPAKCNLKKGDYVVVKKVDSNELLE